MNQQNNRAGIHNFRMPGIPSTQPNIIPEVSKIFFDRLGATATVFGTWAQGVFLGYHADQPGWSTWDIVFSQWAYSRIQDLYFLPQEKCGSLVRQYRTEVDTIDIRRKADIILKIPLTGWDLEMFSRQGYGIAWESGPFAIAESIIRIQRLKKFAGKWWSTLTSSERYLIEERAVMLIADLKVWLPGSLPRLSELLEAAQ